MANLGNGIQLTVSIGPAIPLPVPQPIIDSLTSATITTRTEGASAFELVFTVTGSGGLQTLLALAGGSLPPILRVLLVLTIGGSQEVIMDGVITHQQITPANNGQAQLTVIGEDLSKVMDYIDFSGIPYPAMPREARVAVVCAKYAALGIIPVIIPSVVPDVPIPTDKIPRQKGKDLAYVKSLADEVGYRFYVQCGPEPGMNVAYWGPDVRIGPVQTALNVDMGVQTNVESMNFSFDSESAVLPVVMIHDQTTKVPIPIPIPNVNPLSPPLGLIPPIPKKIEPMSETGPYSPTQAILVGLAKASRTADAVKATGSLSVSRYGKTLKARQLVGVRGGGVLYDGLYYVSEVKHLIKRGDYKQDFTLVRNGLISTVGSVA